MAEHEAIMSPERMEQARRFRKVRYGLMLVSLVVSALYLLVLVAGGGRALREAIAPGADILGSGSDVLGPGNGVGAASPVTLGSSLFVAALLLGHALLQLPVDWYGHLRAREFGLTVQVGASWLMDQAKSFLVGLVLNGGLALLVLWAWGRSPGLWYIWSAALAIAGDLLLTFVSPVLIMPLFHKYTPLAEGELRGRLMHLSERAGVRVRGVFVSDVSRKDTRLNAALTGVGSTRRIILYDTLIEAMSPAEVEVVLGHEMGHHVYGHIVKMTVLSSLFLGAVFVLAGFALRPLSLALGLGGLTPEALPLLMLLFAVVGAPLLPAFMAISRQWERDCDAFALKLTQNAPAFVQAFRKLADRNLADFDPPRWAYYFLYSHPPIPERIAMAERFATGGPS
jgi:STE24 endopeptidase